MNWHFDLLDYTTIYTPFTQAFVYIPGQALYIFLYNNNKYSCLNKVTAYAAIFHWPGSATSCKASTELTISHKNLLKS